MTPERPERLSAERVPLTRAAEDAANVELDRAMRHLNPDLYRLVDEARRANKEWREATIADNHRDPNLREAKKAACAVFANAAHPVLRSLLLALLAAHDELERVRETVRDVFDQNLFPSPDCPDGPGCSECLADAMEGKRRLEAIFSHDASEVEHREKEKA